MKIVRDENQHNDSERDSVVVHRWREEFDIQELILICFELRTLFDLRNRETSTVKRCFRYLNKAVKIEFELRMLLHLCLNKAVKVEFESRMLLHLCLNKTVKIGFESRMLLHLCLREKYDLEIIETLLYLWKRDRISKSIKNLLYLLKNQLLVDFKKCLQSSS
jgi:hypothetical protein